MKPPSHNKKGEVINCRRCGRGQMEIRIGAVICNWCGATVMLPSAETYANLGPNEPFMSATDKLDEADTFHKPRKNTDTFIKSEQGRKVRFSPGSHVVSLRKLFQARKAHDAESDLDEKVKP